MAEAAKAGKVTEKSLLRIQVRVLKDTVALGKWTQIVDRIVPPGVDVFRIKKQWKEDKLEEAVLGSLRSWNSSSSGTVDELIAVFREHELNALADEISESCFGLQPVSSRLDQANSYPVQVKETQGIWQDRVMYLGGFDLWFNYHGWTHTIKWGKKRWGVHMIQNKYHPNADMERKNMIVHTLGVKQEQIEYVSSPMRGEGITSHVEGVYHVFQRYPIYYKYRDIYQVCEEWSEEWSEQCGIK